MKRNPGGPDVLINCSQFRQILQRLWQIDQIIQSEKLKISHAISQMVLTPHHVIILVITIFLWTLVYLVFSLVV